MSFKKLLAYQKAFDLSMEVFEPSKSFPKEETYSLTGKIRRSSRSVCANIAKDYKIRTYLKHFRSKLSDSDSENSGTQVWIDFALSCNYINSKQQIILTNKSIEVGKLINFTISNPVKFGVKTVN